MRFIRRFLRAIRTGQEGTSVTEYGLMVAFVAVALVVVVSTAGASIRDLWDKATCAVYDASCESGTGQGGTGGGTNGGGGGSGGAPPGGGVGSSDPGSGTNGGGSNNDGSNPNGTTNNGGSNNSGAGGKQH